jgi:hypothetical protein
MRYLVTTLIQEPFLTKWFDVENLYNPDPNLDMVVYDLLLFKYYAGDGWIDINEDHL